MTSDDYLYLLIIFSIPLVILLLVSLALWLSSRKLKLKWLQYAGFSLVPLFLVVVASQPWAEMSQEVRYGVELPGYRVEFFEQAGLDIEYFRHFKVYREDGQQAMFLIDNDASRCYPLEVSQEGERVYFQCSGEAMEAASWIDRERQVLYSGWRQAEEAIADLSFEPSAADS